MLTTMIKNYLHFRVYLPNLRSSRSLLAIASSPKEIRINKSNGVEVYHQQNKIPIEALSSGEQHQLVLFFELLFEIRSNSLILIDEPELSLHIAWQKNFIGDLMKIIKLNKFDVILATHSPQLISRWSDLVEELQNVDDDASHGA